MTEKLNGLLAYLDRLERLNGDGYNCPKEIAECISAIRLELDLVNVPKAITHEEVARKLSDLRGKYV